MTLQCADSRIPRLSFKSVQKAYDSCGVAGRRKKGWGAGGGGGGGVAGLLKTEIPGKHLLPPYAPAWRPDDNGCTNIEMHSVATNGVRLFPH